MTTTIKDLQANNQGYYDRSDVAEAKGYDKHVFIAGRILQAAEMNEIQNTAQRQLKGIADSLFKDGDIVRDARCVVDPTTGAATLEAGAIYVQGQVRGVAEKKFSILTKGTVIIGLWLITDVVTATDDPTLLDPATGNRGFNEQGAYRLRIETQWGTKTDNLANGDFYPVYYVDDGNLRAKEPPPNLDAVTQAIARYDVDSNGSNYIISGMRVSRLDDGQNPAAQVYSVASGRARVNGFGITLTSARRIPFAPGIDRKRVIAEGKKVGAPDPNGKQEVQIRYAPLALIDEVRVLKAGTLDPFRGQADPYDLLGNSAGTIKTVVKVYDNSGDYRDQIDYSYDDNLGRLYWLKLDPATSATADPTAKFPAAGSQYNVDVNAWNPVTATDLTDRTFNVTGAVQDPKETKNVEVDYFYYLPRIDRLVVDENGIFAWIKGIATDINPAAPPVPSNLLSICEVNQAWTKNLADSQIDNDGVRMVSMSTLEAMNNRLDALTDMVAQVNLISDINVREAGKKKGLFVDPFLNDSQRDQDVKYVQTLAITGGGLQLAIKGTPLEPTTTVIGQGVTELIACDGVMDDVVLSNDARTSDMKVNPYMAFAPFPAKISLTPQIDRWVETNTTWTGPETRYFTIVEYAPWTLGNVHGQTQITGTNTVNELAGTSTAELEFLRQIPVSFKVDGFRPNEKISAILFDGIDILAQGLVTTP
ncbi:DUF4815 domain-containing protein [Salmonella enterica subsp. enterica serovar Enteritidis]|nr:DUF4815 domain-containing protein [Salmonella enterica subsp. enterica serovar Enteritidis]